MNRFLEQSIEYAQQCSYFDDLFRVYPTIPNGIRDINQSTWKGIEEAFEAKDKKKLINRLLDLELFPVKDSYVAYLKRDRTAIDRNPKTVDRLASEIFEMGLPSLLKRCTLPKETNRQIGPMFRKWSIENLGFKALSIKEFSASNEDGILDASDQAKKDFARERLNYTHDKGLDLLARINGRYVIGEAKFITDMGGHQNAQFEDALATLETRVNAVKVAILDGVLYINSLNKMYKSITTIFRDQNIMSALVLRNFLYQI